MTILEIHQKYKDELERSIQQLYEDKVFAGIGLVGDYTIKIRQLERQLKEIGETISNEAQTQIPEIKETTIGIKIIKIFLASSSELKAEREQIEIFINRENNNLINRKLFIRLVIWEDFIDAMSATRLQEEYNKVITECDIFLSLYYTKVGKYTEEEFDTAFANFKNTSKPFIYTYFKNVENSDSTPSEKESLDTFKHKLRYLGHYPTMFNNIYDLKFQFKTQLEKLTQTDL